MTLRVVGAGLGRTGTMSLKLALERLLGAPCYHMAEVFVHPEHVAVWHAAARGEPVDWHALFAGYAAAVDWPVGSFWPEVSAAFPDALDPALDAERRVVVEERERDDLPRQHAARGSGQRLGTDVDGARRAPLHAAARRPRGGDRRLRAPQR